MSCFSVLWVFVDVCTFSVNFIAELANYVLCLKRACLLCIYMESQTDNFFLYITFHLINMNFL